MDENQKKTLEDINELLAQQRLEREGLKQLSDDELLALKAVGDERALQRAAMVQRQKMLSELLKLQELEQSLGTEIGKEEKARIAQLREILKLKEGELTTTEEINAQKAIEREASEKQLEYAREYDNVWGGIADKIGIGNSKLLVGVNNFAKMAVEISNNKEKMDEFIRSGMRTFSLSNVAFRLLENTIAQAAAVDKARAAFASATGTGYEYQRTLAEINQEGLEMELSMERSVAGLTAVRQSLIGGATESKTFQKALGLQIAEFEKLGIKADDVAGIMNDLQATMGISSGASIEMTKDIAMSAVQMGIAPSKMANDFSRASSTLAVHGRKSVEVFKGLAIAARNAGTDVESLLSISEKFDTFESAADSAGKLNAILGTTMSATEMLMMTEEERIETLIKTVQSTGQSFNQMDRFKQKAIAQAAGINDMAEANRIFGMSLGAYKEQQQEANEAARVQQVFADAMKATLPIQEKIAMALQKMAGNAAMVDGMLRFAIQAVEIFSKVANFLSGDIGTVIIGLGIFSKLLSVIPGVGALFTGFMQALGASFITTGAEMEVGGGLGAGGVAMLSAASTAGAGPIMALGGAMLLLGLAIAAVVLSFAGLVYAFSFLNGDQITGAVVALIGVAAAVYLLVGALAAMANPFTLTGLTAMTGFLTSVGYAAAGIAALVGVIGAVAISVASMMDAGSGAVDAAEGIKQISATLKKAPKRFDVTLENLALITAGKSASLTGTANVVSDAVTNLTNVIKNEIDLTVQLEGDKLKAFILKTVDGRNDDTTSGG